MSVRECSYLYIFFFVVVFLRIRFYGEDSGEGGKK